MNPVRHLTGINNTNMKNNMSNGMKTSKTLLKRLKITKKKKILKRPIHQDHLNAKNSGDEGRRKKGLKRVSKSERKIIKKVLPNRV